MGTVVTVFPVVGVEVPSVRTEGREAALCEVLKRLSWWDKWAHTQRWRACVVAAAVVSAGSGGEKGAERGEARRGGWGRMGARVSSPRRCREEGVIEAKSGVYATSIAQGGPADGATGLIATVPLGPHLHTTLDTLKGNEREET